MEICYVGRKLGHLNDILTQTPDPAADAQESGRWLAHATLEIARIQYPELDPAPYLAELNTLASHLGDRLRNFNDGREFVEKAAEYLFDELGFAGNDGDFYDPRNSCLNQVLERRVGIPITLSLLYMEVARRLKMPVYGVALPRRFVVRYDDGNYSTYIDPYGGGNPITISDCWKMAGIEVGDLRLLAPADPKQILMRMLENLQGAYLRRNEFPQAIQVMDWLILGDPDEPQRYKLRGAIHLELGQLRMARRDLNAYLKRVPTSKDNQAIRDQLAQIHQQLGQLN